MEVFVDASDDAHILHQIGGTQHWTNKLSEEDFTLFREYESPSAAGEVIPEWIVFAKPENSPAEILAYFPEAVDFKKCSKGNAIDRMDLKSRLEPSRYRHGTGHSGRSTYFPIFILISFFVSSPLNADDVFG